MLTTYTVEQAEKTILRRDSAFLFDETEMSEGAKAASQRIYGEILTPEQGVRRILQRVRQEGDAALHHWTAVLDGAELDQFHVDPATIQNALTAIDPELRSGMELAAGRIEQFHRFQPLPDWTTTEMGGILGQRVTPIGRVGVYVPGGDCTVAIIVAHGCDSGQSGGCVVDCRCYATGQKWECARCDFGGGRNCWRR